MPYYDVVNPDPTIEEMKVVVCEWGTITREAVESVLRVSFSSESDPSHCPDALPGYIRWCAWG